MSDGQGVTVAPMTDGTVWVSDGFAVVVIGELHGCELSAYPNPDATGWPWATDWRPNLGAAVERARELLAEWATEQGET